MIFNKKSFRAVPLFTFAVQKTLRKQFESSSPLINSCDNIPFVVQQPFPSPSCFLSWAADCLPTAAHQHTSMLFLSSSQGTDEDLMCYQCSLCTAQSDKKQVRNLQICHFMFQPGSCKLQIIETNHPQRAVTVWLFIYWFLLFVFAEM